MKKGFIAIIVIVVIALIGFVAFKYLGNDNHSISNQVDSEYNATRAIAETQNDNNQQNNSQHAQISSAAVETELYRFSTPIKSHDKNRMTNLKITCSRINGTVVKSGKEFSFCKVVGQPSSADGYKPADAFGKDNKIIKAIGGGNCQVSTTIYNAALGTHGLKITERHEHDRDVAYVEDGKDATVAYDYLDLKFKNTNDYDIKLYASVNDSKLTVKINRVP